MPRGAGAPAGRGGAGAGRGARRCAAAQRHLHLGRHRGQCAGAVARASRAVRRRLSTACWSRPIEHASVLAGGRFPADAVEEIRVDALRRHRSRRLEARCSATAPPALVSVMAANNETGVIQPVAEVAEIVHAPAGCCTSMPCRRWTNAVRYQCARRRPADPFCAQDRRPQGRRRADQARGSAALPIR